MHSTHTLVFYVGTKPLPTDPKPNHQTDEKTPTSYLLVTEVPAKTHKHSSFGSKMAKRK